MKHKSNLSSMLMSVFVLCFFLVSCNDEKNNYYNTPEWLKGSIYKVLEDRGDYSIFLKGVELANMKPMLDGKSILTVMAPNDSAFTVYLNENYGGKKIEELPLDEIKKLIGFHVMYYAFDREKLLNFRPLEGDGASINEKNINAGLYYKFRTYSMDGLTIEKDTAGKDVKVYHLERFLPVFSYRMFQTKQIDAKSNYEYFFPNTEWNDAVGFNVSNAKVSEYSIIADNGYIYTVDRVLRPLETIYTELASNPDYSDYLSLFNSYEYYQVDKNLSLEYGNGDSLYQHYHGLANIACEWPVTDYRMINLLSSVSYSIFAPNNDALRSFFNDYWRVGGYTSLDEVSKTSISYLLYNSVYASSIVFPEEIKNGLIINSFGTKIKFDVDAVPQASRKICVNGALYGLDVLTPPAMFGSVTGPAFQYKKYSYMLDWISASDLVLTLASDETRYIMLYPSDELMNKYDISRDDATGLFYKSNIRISGASMQNYVYAHCVSLDGTTGSYTSLPATGNHVFRTLSPSMNLYWYMKDGKITNCIKYNELLIPGTLEADVFSSISELTFRDGWTNGKCYSYENIDKPYVFEGTQSNAIYGSFVPMMINNRNLATTQYYGFIQLLDKANLMDTETQSILPVVESSLIFVPTTTAVKTGILNNNVPGIKTTSTDINDDDFFDKCTVTDLSKLNFYMLQYFIPLSTAVISNFPYVGWGESSTNQLPTLQSYDVSLGGGKVLAKTTKVVVKDENNKISIHVVNPDGELTGNWVDVIENYHYFPFVFDDGCVQFIKNVL